MKKIYIVVFVFLFILLVLIQFIGVKPDLRQTNNINAIFTLNNTPDEIGLLLKQSCFDCHSNETNFPWYSKIAPISWLINAHIEEGRSHINFSNWEQYTTEKQHALINKCKEEVKENKMPLKSYTLIHRNSKLTSEETIELISWFEYYSNNEIKK
jgi:hypothetical protein